MVVRMRATRSKTRNRRSHHALVATRAARCECGALRMQHRACPECGKYGGKIAIDVVARTEREQRRTKRKEKELQAAGMQTNTKDAKEPEPSGGK